ncbi:MAG: hypothetical protein B5766_12205 [Candidatus Lumbricidophila eiseniae]|uniref:Uncharacterized protein n=1 Tax=Candidatus Lumbricidiphila eiseniae TaxID=1969409 RepID=A0A2A6FNE2_9MICO|nr:MAG: hypothetical protein B5766_12205 [Candidatus Lumbricidophila eiseniae]
MWTFDVTKNRVDGRGSNIAFEFRTVNNVKHLVVSAYIANDSKWINKWVLPVGGSSQPAELREQPQQR